MSSLPSEYTRLACLQVPTSTTSTFTANVISCLWAVNRLRSFRYYRLLKLVSRDYSCEWIYQFIASRRRKAMTNLCSANFCYIMAALLFCGAAAAVLNIVIHRTLRRSIETHIRRIHMSVRPRVTTHLLSTHSYVHWEANVVDITSTSLLIRREITWSEHWSSRSCKQQPASQTAIHADVLLPVRLPVMSLCLFVCLSLSVCVCVCVCWLFVGRISNVQQGRASASAHVFIYTLTAWLPSTQQIRYEIIKCLIADKTMT